MTTTEPNALLWKATQPDGTTRNGVAWAVGKTVTHPTSTVMLRNGPSTYLSLSAEPAETLIGGSWPCRLFRVRPVGDVIGSDQFLHKRCVLVVEVVEEVEAWRALGPNGEAVAALIDRCGSLTESEAAQLAAARAAARAGTWAAAWVPAREAAREAARVAAREAAVVLVVRDLISAKHFETLIRPWASVVGEP